MTEVAKLVLKTNRLLLTGRGFHRSLEEISEESANTSTAALHRCKKSTKADSMCIFLPLTRWEACWSPCHPAAWSPKAANRWGLQSTYSYPWGRKKKKGGKGNILISQKARKRFSRSFIILLYLKQSICWLSAPPAHKSTHTHTIQKITLKLFSFTADNVTS